MSDLTVKQAFQAMVLFLEGFYERTQSDDVGALLGDLLILEDGSTADPAAWDDWLNSVGKVLEGHTASPAGEEEQLPLTIPIDVEQQPTFESKRVIEVV